MITPEETQLVIAAKADEILDTTPNLQGLLIVGSESSNDETFMHVVCRGNRHAAIAAAEEWLASAKAYDHAYHAEQGRYDAVVHRNNRP